MFAGIERGCTAAAPRKPDKVDEAIGEEIEKLDNRINRELSGLRALKEDHAKLLSALLTLRDAVTKYEDDHDLEGAKYKADAVLREVLR